MRQGICTVQPSWVALVGRAVVLSLRSILQGTTPCCMLLPVERTASFPKQVWLWMQRGTYTVPRLLAVTSRIALAPAVAEWCSRSRHDDKPERSEFYPKGGYPMSSMKVAQTFVVGRA